MQTTLGSAFSHTDTCTLEHFLGSTDMLVHWVVGLPNNLDREGLQTVAMLSSVGVLVTSPYCWKSFFWQNLGIKSHGKVHRYKWVDLQS